MLEKILLKLYEVAPGFHDFLSGVLEDSALKFTNSKLTDDVFLLLIMKRNPSLAHFL